MVLPQPDSPTSPNVSPRRMWKETPSTARTTDRRPNRLPRTGKCLTKFLTWSSGSVTRVLFIVAPAWRRMAGCHLSVVEMQAANSGHGGPAPWRPPVVARSCNVAVRAGSAG